MQPTPAGSNFPLPGLPPIGSVTPPSQVAAPNPFAVANPLTPPKVRALPTLGELLNAFKRRWVLCLMIGGVLAAVLAAAVWMALPSGKHTVMTTLRFKSSRAESATGIDIRIPTEEFDAIMENHKTLIESHKFLDKVATRPEVARQQLIEAAPAGEKGKVIKDAMTFKRSSTEIVNLTMNGDESEQMQIILRNLSQAYIDQEKDEDRGRRDKSRRENDTRIRLMDKEIDDLEKKMKALVENGSDPGQLTALENQMQIIQANRQAAFDARRRFAVQREQAQKKLTENKFENDPDDERDFLSGNQPVMTAEGKRTAAAESLVKVKNSVKSPTDPSVVQAEKNLKQATEAVVDAKKQALGGAAAITLKDKAKRRLEVLIQKLIEDEEQAQKAVESAESQLKTLGEQKKQMSVVAVELEILRKNLDPKREDRVKLQKDLEDLNKVEQNQGDRITILEDATKFLNSNLKQKMVFAAVAALAGLIGVGLFISYLEWRNRRVDGVEQVVSELGMRVIGTIPAFPSRAALRSGEAGANQNWRFILNESVNSTRTMLLHTARTQQMQVILVTSAMQGEGKTSLSSQLATSMATAGLRTLILDCDLRNPSMQKLFDIPVAPGCAEVLLQEIDISDVVQATSVPNLWIIPAGQCNHRVIAALAQGHPIEALLNRLRGQFDIIVVDSCPILPVADTLLVAQHVDGVVFSILQDVSQLPKVQDASDRLTHLNIPLLGAVVNGIKPDTQAYGYNYVKQLPA